MKNKFTIKGTEIHRKSSGKILGLSIKVKALDCAIRFNEETDVVQRNINKTCFLKDYNSLFSFIYLF